MPVDYTVHFQGTFVYARASGEITDDDLIAHERKLMQDPRVAPGFRQLLDCRWISEDELTQDVLKHLHQIHGAAEAKVAGARYAVVAHSTSWFQIGARYRCEDHAMALIVFNDLSIAYIWLGVSGLGAEREEDPSSSCASGERASNEGASNERALFEAWQLRVAYDY